MLVNAGLTENGWVRVDPLTLATPFHGVYALGDCAETGIPKAGVFAESAARAVADEIAASLLGGRPRPYDGSGLFFVEMGDGEVGRVDVSSAPMAGPQLQCSDLAPSTLPRRPSSERSGGPVVRPLARLDQLQPFRWGVLLTRQLC